MSEELEKFGNSEAEVNVVHVLCCNMRYSIL